MNDADRTPSPKRFWRKFGILSAARKASAAGNVPRKCANARSRTNPATLLNRIPLATKAAGRPEACSFLGGVVLGKFCGIGMRRNLYSIQILRQDIVGDVRNPRIPPALLRFVVYLDLAEELHAA